MLVILTKEAFLVPEDERPLLHAVLSEGVQRRHDVIVEDEAMEFFESFLAEQSQPLRLAYARAVQDGNGRQALSPSTARARVVQGGESIWSGAVWECCLADALDLLRLSLEILVEDETSDAAFLEAVADPTLRASWNEALQSRRIRFVNLGGITQVPRRLKGRRVTPPLSLRSVVLVDSDAPVPWKTEPGGPEESWGNLPADTRKAARAAGRAGIGVYVLQRRMAENYLPASALLEWAMQLPASGRTRKTAHADAFGRLGTERQRYHHLKGGVKATERDLYSGTSAEDMEALEHSMGSSTWEAFDHVTEASLRAGGVYDELQPLMQSLLRTA